MPEPYIVLPVAVIIISILGRKLAHLGGWNIDTGWDVEDFLFGYELSLLTIILAIQNVLGLWPSLSQLEFSTSSESFYKLIDAKIVKEIAFIFCAITITFNLKYGASRPIETKLMFRILHVVVSDVAGVALYLILNNNFK